MGEYISLWWMVIRKLINIFTNDYELQRIQSNLNDWSADVTDSEFLSGNFVNSTLSASDTLVVHGLGRKYVGWCVVDIDSAASVYRSATQNKRPEQQIILKASAPCNVKLYIY